VRGRSLAVTCAAASLVELRSRSEFYKTSGCVTRLGLRHRLSCRSPTRGVGSRALVQLSLPCDATRTTILSSGSVLLQGLTRSSRRAPLDARHLSWGSCPYSACRWEESTLLPPAVPSADYVPSTGFRPSRRFAPLPTSPTPFGAGSTHGVLPTGVSPLEQASELVAHRMPSWHCSPGLRSLLLGKERTVGARTVCLGACRPHLCVAFKALLRSRVRAVREHG